GTLHLRRGTPKICGHRTGYGTQWQEILGTLAFAVSDIPPTNVRGMGRRIDPAFLLGPSLLPAATRQGESAPGGCARLGLQMDPPPLSLLARAPPLRGVYLSPGTPAPWLLADPKSGKGVLNDRKKTLTAPLRACVRDCLKSRP